MKHRAGYTLLELILVLLLSVLLLGAAVAPISRARSVLAVRAARADLSALLAVTRSTAIAAGGASLHVDVTAGAAWIEIAPGERNGDVQYIGARHDVSLSATSPVLVIRYDALGIGRMSNATVHLRRGPITGTVTISAYGRVRQS